VRLNERQQRIVEENIGLVGKVIKDKVHGLGQADMLSYDDLFQIGCIGLCKAAATDKGGIFSTYAYRLIWNEICDALIKLTRTNSREQVQEPTELIRAGLESVWDRVEEIDWRDLLQMAESRSDGTVRQGIRALKLTMDGYSSKEVGKILQAQPGTVRMWMTKARRFLKEQPEIQAVMRV